MNSLGSPNGARPGLIEIRMSGGEARPVKRSVRSSVIEVRSYVMRGPESVVLLPDLLQQLPDRGDVGTTDHDVSRCADSSSPPGAVWQRCVAAAVFLTVLTTAGPGVAQEEPLPPPEAVLPPLVVEAPPALSSSSEVLIPGKSFELRPQGRPADILRLIPGFVIAQHHGGGKADQYFLRGFDGDHGTDIAFFDDGLPVNLRSHAHGQGYTDLHFIILRPWPGSTCSRGRTTRSTATSPRRRPSTSSPSTWWTRTLPRRGAGRSIPSAISRCTRRLAAP